MQTTNRVNEGTVKILLNARALIQNSSFRIEVDGRLLEATLYGNIKEFIY